MNLENSIIKEIADLYQILDSYGQGVMTTNLAVVSSPTSVRVASRSTELLRLENQNPHLVSKNSPIRRVDLDKVIDSKLFYHQSSFKDYVPHRATELISISKALDLDGDKAVSVDLNEGLRVCIVYQDGEFLRAGTSGDGRVGLDITDIIRCMSTIPLQLHSDDSPDSVLGLLEFRGVLTLTGESCRLLSSFLSRQDTPVECSFSDLSDSLLYLIRNYTLGDISMFQIKFICYQHYSWHGLKHSKHSEKHIDSGTYLFSNSTGLPSLSSVYHDLGFEPFSYYFIYTDDWGSQDYISRLGTSASSGSVLSSIGYSDFRFSESSHFPSNGLLPFTITEGFIVGTFIPNTLSFHILKDGTVYYLIDASLPVNNSAVRRDRPYSVKVIYEHIEDVRRSGYFGVNLEVTLIPKRDFIGILHPATPVCRYEFKDFYSCGAVRRPYRGVIPSFSADSLCSYCGEDLISLQDNTFCSSLHECPGAIASGIMDFASHDKGNIGLLTRDLVDHIVLHYDVNTFFDLVSLPLEELSKATCGYCSADALTKQMDASKNTTLAALVDLIFESTLRPEHFDDLCSHFNGGSNPTLEGIMKEFPHGSDSFATPWASSAFLISPFYEELHPHMMKNWISNLGFTWVEGFRLIADTYCPMIGRSFEYDNYKIFITGELNHDDRTRLYEGIVSCGASVVKNTTDGYDLVIYGNNPDMKLMDKHFTIPGSDDFRPLDSVQMLSARYVLASGLFSLRQ